MDDIAKPNRGGPPIGSTNNFRHGLRGSLLPPHMGHIKKAIDHFRREIEKAAIEAHGEISLVHAAIINTCYRWERHAQCSQYWLAKHADEMSISDKLKCSHEIARASSARDKALESLGIERPPELFNGSLVIPSIEAESKPEDANE